jgi:hypothetical protein
VRVPATGGEPFAEIDGAKLPASESVSIVDALLWNLDISPDGASLLIGAPVAPKFELWSLPRVMESLAR